MQTGCLCTHVHMCEPTCRDVCDHMCSHINSMQDLQWSLFLLSVAPSATCVGVSRGKGESCFDVGLRPRPIQVPKDQHPPTPAACTRRVPKVTRGPQPEPRASWTARPTAQPRPSPLTVGRDAGGEPEHQTPPARGADDHLRARPGAAIPPASPPPRVARRTSA